MVLVGYVMYDYTKPSMIVCVCIKGPIGDILSWSGWAPLSKLTYAAYLIHPYILYADWMNRFTPQYAEHFMLVSSLCQ